MAARNWPFTWIYQARDEPKGVWWQNQPSLSRRQLTQSCHLIPHLNPRRSCPSLFEPVTTILAGFPQRKVPALLAPKNGARTTESKIPYIPPIFRFFSLAGHLLRKEEGPQGVLANLQYIQLHMDSVPLLPVTVPTTPSGVRKGRSGAKPKGLGGAAKDGAFRACALGLGLVLAVYGMFYVLLEKGGEADCPVCHEVITPATSRLHTEGYHSLLRERWNPTRFHDNATRWRDCVAKTHPDYPALSEYEHVRPVFIWTWHTLENFLYIHQASTTFTGRLLVVTDFSGGERRSLCEVVWCRASSLRMCI
jgi:hypothetical protein